MVAKLSDVLRTDETNRKTLCMKRFEEKNSSKIRRIRVYRMLSLLEEKSLQPLLQTLKSPTEEWVLVRYYGLRPDIPLKPIKEMAVELHITYQTVLNRLDRAVRKMLHPSRRRFFPEAKW